MIKNPNNNRHPDIERYDQDEKKLRLALKIMLLITILFFGFIFSTI